MTNLHFARALTPQGWRCDVRVTLAGARIGRVETGVAPQAGDERHALGLPALGNLHSHAFQRAMAGLAERRGEGTDSFWTWRSAMYATALALSPDDVESIATQAYVEMLEAGFAAVAEFHYLHHAPDGRAYDNPGELAERVAAAAARAGIGLTLLPVFYAHATFGAAPPLPEQRRFINNLDGFARIDEASRRATDRLPFARSGIAPHSLRAVAADEIAGLVALAPAGPLHIHVAEQAREVADCLAWRGTRPVRLLLDIAAIDERWCLVHATHMDDSEIASVAASCAVVGLCPTTEANLGDGIFSARPFLAAGGRFGIGTDSHIEIGAPEELRLLEYGQRLALRVRNACAPAGGSTGRALYAMALAGGAQALCRPCGAIAPGMAADLVALDALHPSLAGRDGDEILNSWIFNGGRGAVEGVWSAGRKLVTGGRHHERVSVATRFRSTMRSLREQLDLP